MERTEQGDAVALAERVDARLRSLGLAAETPSTARLAAEVWHLQVHGRRSIWQIVVEAGDFSDRLPKVWVSSPGSHLAHVSYAGLICIGDESGLSIDTAQMAEVRAQAAADAVRVLENAAEDASEGGHDFFNELEGYWLSLPDMQVSRAAIAVDARSRYLYAHVQEQVGGKQYCRFVTETDGKSPSEFNTSKSTIVRCLYLALGEYVSPPLPGEPLTADFVEKALRACGPTEQKLWEGLTKTQKGAARKFCCVFFSVPRQQGGRSLIGASFYLREGQLVRSAPMTPLVLRRHTPEYMRERGGASNSFASKHVVVIGCGSLGSEVADALASIGVGKLTLVDPDLFDVENVFRHALGRDQVGAYKVEALGVELERKYPGVAVVPVQKDGATWMRTAALEDVSALVIGVGQPSIERDLTRLCRARGAKLPVVVAWLEALGLGGHAVSIPASGPGCLGCLYRDHDGKPSLTSLTAFIEPGQVVSRTFSGCLGNFIPYSALHSRKTALLAAEVTVDALRDGSAPLYRYWAGDDAAARAQGILTTAWHRRAGMTTCEEAARSVFRSFCSECRSASCL